MSSFTGWLDLTHISRFEREDGVMERIRKGVKYHAPTRVQLDAVEREASRHPSTIKRERLSDWSMPKQHRLIVVSESGYTLTLHKGFKADCQTRQQYLESAIRNLKVRQPSRALMGHVLMIALMGPDAELTIVQ